MLSGYSNLSIIVAKTGPVDYNPVNGACGVYEYQESHSTGVVVPSGIRSLFSDGVLILETGCGWAT